MCVLLPCGLRLSIAAAAFRSSRVLEMKRNNPPESSSNSADIVLIIIVPISNSRYSNGTSYGHTPHSHIIIIRYMWEEYMRTAHHPSLVLCACVFVCVQHKSSLLTRTMASSYNVERFHCIITTFRIIKENSISVYATHATMGKRLIITLNYLIENNGIRFHFIFHFQSMGPA